MQLIKTSAPTAAIVQRLRMVLLWQNNIPLRPRDCRGLGPVITIERCGFDKMVELSIEKGRLVITAGRRPREGWREAFRAAVKSAADELLLEPLKPNTFDQEEWKW